MPEPGARSHEARSRALGRDLAWLTGIMWPEADVALSPSRVPPGRRVAEAYAVIPSAARPRLLVPFATPTLIDVAMRRSDDGMSAVARARRALGRRLAASSIGWARFPALVVFFDREPRVGELLTQHLRSILETPDVVTAISLGPPGPDRKPVVEALTQDGDVLAFAKVGWNEPTQALLRTEAAALRRWSLDHPKTFRSPELVHEGPWREHAITLTAPIQTAGARLRRGRMPSADVTREVARGGGVAVMPLASTSWWRSVIERASAGGEATTVVLRWMQELHGRRSMWHGAWHGDWRPQNMATVSGVLHVWDWERAADAVPIGLDPLHYAFQEALRRRGGSVPRSSRAALRVAAEALRGLGVPSEDDALLMACCLAETLARLEEGRRHGAVTPPRTRESLLDELRKGVGRA